MDITEEENDREQHSDGAGVGAGVGAGISLVESKKETYIDRNTSNLPPFRISNNVILLKMV